MYFFFIKKVHLSAESACQETFFKYKIVLCLILFCATVQYKKDVALTAIKCKVLEQVLLSPALD